MCLSQTPTGVHAGASVCYCPQLPAGAQYFDVPLPGAGPFACPRPCGGRCALAAGHDNAPPPPTLPAGEVFYSLRLKATAAALVAAALAHAPGRPGCETAPHPRPGELTMAGRRCIGRN